MFRTRRELTVANAKVDALWQAQIEGRYDLRNAYVEASKLSEANATHALTILAQQQEITVLRRKCEELADHIRRQNEVPTQFASGPLWMSEEEEEARYQYDQGDIDRGMLTDKLKELGLDPDITSE